jgi:hypothetical protein
LSLSGIWGLIFLASHSISKWPHSIQECLFPNWNQLI